MRDGEAKAGQDLVDGVAWDEKGPRLVGGDEVRRQLDEAREQGRKEGRAEAIDLISRAAKWHALQDPDADEYECLEEIGVRVDELVDVEEMGGSSWEDDVRRALGNLQIATFAYADKIGVDPWAAFAGWLDQLAASVEEEGMP